MRKLTIKREKSFAGFLGKAKIYLEDPTYNDININGIPCRKIGTLKNNEKKIFSIDTKERKLFIIFDRLSKGYCSEYYQLPEGEEDICLSGRNCFNLFNGNAFRFYNNDTEEVLSYRKRCTRKGAIVFLVAVIIGFCAGFFVADLIIKGKENNNNAEQVQVSKKTFTAEGMSISLTDEFVELDLPNQTVAYHSKNVGVSVLKEKFSLMPGFQNYTIEQYLELVLKVNRLSLDYVRQVDGLTGFVFDKIPTDSKEVYRYFAYVYKADDAFWLIQFSTLRKNADQYEQQIVEWAKSVSFESKSNDLNSSIY